MKFRPCIDLHNGKVKQIVGSSLQDGQPDKLKINFIADKSSAHFAEMYRSDNLTGGHIIKLGPGNDEAARIALQSWPGGMQIGGGITLDNASGWLDCGASHIIVTSCVFKQGKVDRGYLKKLVDKVGHNRLVLDLSCRKRQGQYYIVTDRWQKFTEVMITPQTLEEFAGCCDEFLIHAADVEGKCAGVEIDLVEKLGEWVTVPTTYAGGVRGLEDMELVHAIGNGCLDVTIGSALDIFGGSGVTYREAVALHRKYQSDKK
jgi:phosphoribosylformimino-5-aminoimidazole carboxamide ribotide isomerase